MTRKDMWQLENTEYAEYQTEKLDEEWKKLAAEYIKKNRVNLSDSNQSINDEEKKKVRNMRSIFPIKSFLNKSFI